MNVPLNVASIHTVVSVVFHFYCCQLKTKTATVMSKEVLEQDNLS